MSKLKVSSEVADDLRWKYRNCDKTLWSEHRWSTYWRCRVEYQGRSYWLIYQEGNTENQDYVESFDDAEVEMTEIHEVEKLMKVWEPVT